MAVVINGKRYAGDSLEIKGDRVFINGQRITELEDQLFTKRGFFDFSKRKTIVEIRVTEGTLLDLRTDGSVHCGSVARNVHAGGSVTCDNVGGSVSAGGSVTAGRVNGHISAGGAVSTK